MKLEKGLLYAFIYGWRDRPPLRTNLCGMFWSFWLALLWGWPIVVTSMFLWTADVPTKHGRRTWRAWYRRFDDVGPFPILLLLALSLGICGCLLYIVLFIFGVVGFESNAFLVGLICWVALISIGIAFAISEYKKYARRKKLDESSNEEPPGLFILWLKAKKEKVCPLIEFQD